MTQEVNPCDYCHNALQEGEATSTLLCMHKVHTTCFLKANCADSPRFLQCPTCHAPLCTPDLLQTFVEAGVLDDHDSVFSIHEGNNNNIITMYDEQEEFRKDVKAYHKQICKTSTAQAKFHAIVRQRKRQFREQMQEIKEAIQAEVKTQKQAVKQSAEYKTFIKEHRKYMNLQKEFREKYHVNRMQLANHLHNKPGLRRWPHLYRSRRFLYAFNLYIH